MPDEPMSEERLADYEEMGRRWTEQRIGPIIARQAILELTAEVRRLRSVLNGAGDLMLHLADLVEER